MAKSVSHGGRKLRLLAEEYFDDLLRRSKLTTSPQMRETLELDKELELLLKSHNLPSDVKDSLIKRLTADFLHTKGKAHEITGHEGALLLRGKVEPADGGELTVTDDPRRDPPMVAAPVVARASTETAAGALAKTDASSRQSPGPSQPLQKPESQSPTSQSFDSKEAILTRHKHKGPVYLDNIKYILGILQWDKDTGQLLDTSGHPIESSNIDKLLETIGSVKLKQGELNDLNTPGLSEAINQMSSLKNFKVDKVSNPTLRKALNRIMGNLRETRGAESRGSPKEKKDVLSKLSKVGMGKGIKSGKKKCDRSSPLSSSPPSKRRRSQPSPPPQAEGSEVAAEVSERVVGSGRHRNKATVGRGGAPESILWSNWIPKTKIGRRRQQ